MFPLRPSRGLCAICQTAPSLVVINFRRCKDTHKKKMPKEALDIYITYITISITLAHAATHHAVLRCEARG